MISTRRLEGQGLCDLHELLVGDGQPPRRPVRVQVHAELLEQLHAPAAQRRPVDPAQRAQRLAADEDVLRDREVREQRRLLVDHRDPGGARVGRPGQRQRLACQRERPGVRCMHPGQDLDERGLPRAVLADQPVRLARVELDVDLAQGGDRVERLGHTGEGEQRLVHLTALRL
jgi:hypothetical protein